LFNFLINGADKLVDHGVIELNMSLPVSNGVHDVKLHKIIIIIIIYVVRPI